MKNKRRPCAGPFKTPAIMWNGDLTICCFDSMMNLSLGNLKEKSFDELWYGEKANEIRLKQIKGDFDQILTKWGFPKCLHCKGYDTPQITDEEIIEFLKSIGREELIKEYLERVND